MCRRSARHAVELKLNSCGAPVSLCPSSPPSARQTNAASLLSAPTFPSARDSARESYCAIQRMLAPRRTRGGDMRHQKCAAA